MRAGLRKRSSLANPHPALRATFSRKEKDTLDALFANLDNSALLQGILGSSSSLLTSGKVEQVVRSVASDYLPECRLNSLRQNLRVDDFHSVGDVKVSTGIGAPISERL